MATLLDSVRYDSHLAQRFARALSGNDELKVFEHMQNPGDKMLFWPCQQCKAAYIVVPAETIMGEEEEGVVSCACSKCAVTTRQAWVFVLLYNLALGHELVTPAVVKAAVAE